MLDNTLKTIKYPFRPVYYELQSRFARPFGGRALDFYFLSTGRCGTRYIARVLDLASNAIVYHEPNPSAYEDCRRKTDEYFRNPESIKNTDYSRYPMLRRKMRINASIQTKIYGETANLNYPFAVIFHSAIPNRVKLLHLIRNPVDCCRSIIRVESDEYGYGFARHRAKSLLERKGDLDRAISVYTKITEMIRVQFECIDDPSVCKVVRVEDTSVELFKELYDFLELEGFDADKVNRLINDKSDPVRHSHMARMDKRGIPDIDEHDIEYIKKRTEGIQELGG